MRYLFCVLVLCSCAVEVEIAKPSSLVGTEVDGDFSGAFVLDENAQRTFDYFLTAEGELEDAALDLWADAELAKKLSGQALQDARDGWRRYRDYRRAAQEVLSTGQKDRLAEVIDTHLAGTPLASAEKVRLLDPRSTVEPDAYVEARRRIEAAKMFGADRETIERLRIEAFGKEAAARLAALDARRKQN